MHLAVIVAVSAICIVGIEALGLGSTLTMSLQFLVIVLAGLAALARLGAL